MTILMNFAISISNLTKLYPKREAPEKAYLRLLLNRQEKVDANAFIALQGVSFNVQKREAIGIIGANGAGKSTLLKILCGTLKQTSGEFSVNGKISSLLELGSVFNQDFTGAENVMLAAAIYGLDIKINSDIYKNIVNFSGLKPHYLDMPVKTYSSGMFLRLAFSVIANIKSDIIIIDEALAVGDSFFNQKCIEFLKNFNKTGTLVLVSHSLGAIQAMCSRVVWLDNGRIAKIGPPKEVIEHYSNYMLSEKDKSNNQKVRERLTKDVKYNFDDVWVSRDNSIELLGVRLIDLLTEQEISSICSSNIVRLEINFKAYAKFEQLIFGFYFKNNQGIEVFGENSYLSTDGKIKAEIGNEFKCYFKFKVPRLPFGDYFVSVACADGTQLNHEVKLWAHSALKLSYIENHYGVGMVGLNSCTCEISVKE